MSTAITIIYFITTITASITVTITCFKVMGYMDIKKQEIYKKEMYEQAKRDIQDIKEQLTRNETDKPQ